MAKFTLGKNPQNFKREVLIDNFDGTQDTIEMTFKYRTRSQYAQLVDEMIEGAGAFKAKAKKTDDAEKVLTLKSMLAEQDDLTVNFLMQVADGWDLTDEFNAANIKRMKDEVPAAIEAITEAYRVSILEGRLKN